MAEDLTMVSAGGIEVSARLYRSQAEADGDSPREFSNGPHLR